MSWTASLLAGFQVTINGRFRVTPEGLEEYNDQRPHSGKYCFGKAPMQCFLDSRQLAWDKLLDQITPATNAIAS
jgi:hypothetical protein